MTDRPNRTHLDPLDGQLPLGVVFTGHVDHGKSTLIGRILHDADSLPEGKIDLVKKACAAEKMEFEFAFVLEEQKQNVTIDPMEIRFKTKRRKYIIIEIALHTDKQTVNESAASILEALLPRIQISGKQ